MADSLSLAYTVQVILQRRAPPLCPRSDPLLLLNAIAARTSSAAGANTSAQTRECVPLLRQSRAAAPPCALRLRKIPGVPERSGPPRSPQSRSKSRAAAACLAPAEVSKAYTRTFASTNSHPLSALMEFVARPAGPALRAERSVRTQCGQTSSARCRIATIFVRQACQRLGHQRGDRGIPICGEAFDSLQKFAGQTQSDVLTIAHEKQCSTKNRDADSRLYGSELASPCVRAIRQHRSSDSPSRTRKRSPCLIHQAKFLLLSRHCAEYPAPLPPYSAYASSRLSRYQRTCASKVPVSTTFPCFICTKIRYFPGTGNP